MFLQHFNFPFSSRIALSRSQPWMFTLDGSSRFPSQLLPLYKDFIHSCLSIFLAETLLDCMLPIPSHSNQQTAGAPKVLQRSCGQREQEELKNSSAAAGRAEEAEVAVETCWPQLPGRLHALRLEGFIYHILGLTDGF